jgi:SPP1 family predicted phage head-tail adaptor
MPPLAAGKLRHRIILQEAVESQNADTGAMEITHWDDVAALWASIEPLSAREFIAAQAESNKVTAKIIIRYRAGINPRMRLFHEAKGVYYNIEGILADLNSGKEYMTLPVSEGLKYQGDPLPS